MFTLGASAHSGPTVNPGDGCYDFRNTFDQKFGEKNWLICLNYYEFFEKFSWVFRKTPNAWYGVFLKTQVCTNNSKVA
jgi:hypothetical protein